MLKLALENIIKESFHIIIWSGFCFYSINSWLLPTQLSVPFISVNLYSTCIQPVFNFVVAFRARGHGTTSWPIRSHGQECNLQYDSNRTVHHQNHLGTHFIDSKPVTPTPIDPCRCPDNHCRDLPWPLPQRGGQLSIVTDELTPSK
jgi:hypothetical protein